jgi:hypothetical protein
MKHRLQKGAGDPEVKKRERRQSQKKKEAKYKSQEAANPKVQERERRQGRDEVEEVCCE